MPALWEKRADGIEVCTSGHEVLYRGYTPPRVETRAVDKDARLIDFILSTGAVDDYLTQFVTRGIDLRRAKRYAPWLWFHRVGDPALGRIVAARKILNGPPEEHQIQVRTHFAGDEQRHAFAEMIFLLHRDRFLEECSLGAAPTARRAATDDAGRTIIQFTRSVLAEGSSVNRGSTPGATIVRGGRDAVSQVREIARECGVDGSELDHFMNTITGEGDMPPQDQRRAADPSLVAGLDDGPIVDSFGDWDAPVGGTVTVRSATDGAAEPNPSPSPEVPPEPSPGPESGGAEGRVLTSSTDSEAPPDAVPVEPEVQGEPEPAPPPAPEVETRAATVPPEIIERLEALEAAVAAAPERAAEQVAGRVSEMLTEHRAALEQTIQVSQADLWVRQQVQANRDSAHHRAVDADVLPATSVQVRHAPAPTRSLTRDDLDAMGAEAYDRAARRHRGEIDV